MYFVTQFQDVATMIDNLLSISNEMIFDESKSVSLSVVILEC